MPQQYGRGMAPGTGAPGPNQYERPGVESTYFTEGRFDMYRDDLQGIRDKEAGIDDRWKSEFNNYQQEMDKGYGNLYSRQRAEAGAEGYNAGNLRMANQGIGGMKMQQAQQSDMMQKQMMQGNSLDDYLRSQQGMDQLMGMHQMGAKANQLAAQQSQTTEERWRREAERWKTGMDQEEQAVQAAAGTAVSTAASMAT